MIYYKDFLKQQKITCPRYLPALSIALGYETADEYMERKRNEHRDGNSKN